MSSIKPQGPVPSDEIDLAILHLLTPSKKEDLKNELSWFIDDYHLPDVENHLALILHCIIDTDNSLMEQRVRSNTVFFVGRIVNLLRHLMPPNPVMKSASKPIHKKAQSNGTTKKTKKSKG